MLVIGANRMSKQSLIMKVGQGSRSQDLVGALEMSFLTSSWDRGLKLFKGGGL